ncbi:MAG TPA: choice-of-anchor D domain-containing protein, partial [Candidatus Kapabacteria bacterium]|nr:choice-of-anchor D domain-containing protein [Candidatus Kapabacteria bacterium]
NDTRIASISMITAASDPRWPKPSFNYTFIPETKFQIGDSVYLATITVNDPAQDAYAAIYAVDLAGNDTVYQYYYFAPKVKFSPASPYDFGAILDGTDSCRTITITNVQQGGEFIAESDSIGGFAKGGTFTVTPTKLGPIPDNASISLTVCFHPSDTGVASVDSLYVVSQCVPYVFPLTGTGITPLIYVTDLAFGEVDSGKTKCLPLTIYNRGKAPLTITAQDLAVSDPNFSIDPNQKFPIVLQPGQSTQVSYCFHPQTWGSFGDSVNFLNQNPTEFQRSIKDYALLTGIATPAGAQLTSYLKNFTVSCNDTTLFDTLFDNLPADKSITGVSWVGADSSFFTVNDTSYTFLLKGNHGNEIDYRILYNPTKNGLDLTPRTVTLQVHAAEGGPQPALAIQAQLVTPIVQVSPNFVDLGTSRINQASLPKTFTITNSGNAPLVITSYNLGGADAGSFTFTPAPPLTIPAGDSQVVSVTATGSETRSYSGNGSIIGPCNTVTYAYQGAFSSVNDLPLGTNHPTTYVGGCRTNTQDASFKNENSQDSITITALSIAGLNPNDFSIGTPFQHVGVGPDQTDSIPIIFLPLATGQRQATLIFTLKGKASTGADSTWTESVLLKGSGAAVSRQVGIGSVTAAPQYHSMAGNGVSIPVVVNTPIDVSAPDNGTTEAYGYQFRVSWKRDAFKYIGTVPANVSVSNPTYDAPTDMETRVFKFESPVPLTGVVTLATINVLSMLTKSDTTGIQLSSVAWLDKDTIPLCYVSDTSFDGSHVLDQICGNSTIQNFLLKGAINVDDIRPNPAGASAEVDYTLASARSISVSIYDLLGNEVKQLMDMTPETEGAHTLQFNSDGLPSGSYYCRVTDGHFVATRPFEVAK